LEGKLSCQPHCGGGSGPTGDRDVSSLDILCPDTKLETEIEEKGYLILLWRAY